MGFRWNRQDQSVRFWDPSVDDGQGVESETFDTDKQTLQSPGAKRFEDILQALCRVALELIELEESRQKRMANDMRNEIRDLKISSRASHPSFQEGLKTKQCPCGAFNFPNAIYCERCGR